jgi:Ca2+-binding EF-hand superfamily protein
MVAACDKKFITSNNFLL